MFCEYIGARLHVDMFDDVVVTFSRNIVSTHLIKVGI